MRFLSEFDGLDCKGHERRFAASLDWITPLLLPEAVVYDFGQGLDGCPFTRVVQRMFPLVDLRNTGAADLRFPIPVPDSCADVALAMEIIEHMKDRETDAVDQYCFSGVKNLLAEAYRVLRPGGALFLSTPNGSQYTTAWRLIRGDGSTWYYAHIHEFGFNELQSVVGAAGFVIQRIEAVDVWEPQDCPHLLRAMMEHLAPAIPRGDCLFLLACKPEVTPCQ